MFKPGDVVFVNQASHTYCGKLGLILSEIKTELRLGDMVYFLEHDPFYSVLIDEKEILMFARHLDKV